MMNCCCCESQQEAWIREAAEGKPNRFRKDNPRVIDMLESFDCTPPYVDIERARYFTESMKQTEGRCQSKKGSPYRPSSPECAASRC